MSNNASPLPAASAFEAGAQQENKISSEKVNPASTAAQELRETGMRPVAVDETVPSQGAAPEKKSEGEDREKTKLPPSENPPAEAVKQQEEEQKKEREKPGNTNPSAPVVGSGEEVAGVTQLAAEKASAAAAQAKVAAVAAAASAATATKETARKYGAAAVIDAELMYAAGKERVAGWVQGSQDAMKGAVQKVSAKSGEVLKNVGDKLVEAGKPPPPPVEEEKEPPPPPPQGGGIQREGP